MAASVQFRPQSRDLGMVMREVDEDLAIFLGIRNGEERNDHVLIENFDEFGASKRAENVQIVADDCLLNLEIECSDYDWLTPEKIEVQDSAMNQIDVSKDETVSSKSELANASEKSATSTSLDSSNAASRRSSSSGDRKPTPRSSTPTGRASLPVKSKPSRASTPTSRATSEPSRASSIAALTSSKPVATQVRSSTPSKAISRSSTPASRPTIPARSKSASRSATPTRKPATPSTISSVSSSDGSSSGRKTALKNPVPTRGISQTVRSRPSSKPSDILSLSHDAPQNPKTFMPKRPASASRGRPSAPAAHLSSSNGKPRQKSCSPAKVRAPNGISAHKIGNIMPSRSQGYGHDGGDDVNPVMMGTKMVARVVNMRKLAPPKLNEPISLDKPKKSSQENTGFGRSLSKRSLDMAIRHMDIRRSINIPDNLRPVATGVSSCFPSGNQSSSSQSSSVGFSESPLTSTSDSSKSRNCVNSYFLDGRRMDD